MIEEFYISTITSFVKKPGETLRNLKYRIRHLSPRDNTVIDQHFSGPTYIWL